MLTEIGEVKKDTIEEQIHAVRDALNEVEDNLAKLFEGDSSEQLTDYIQGDAYEIEQRTEKLCQNARHVAGAIEAEREDEDE